MSQNAPTISSRGLSRRSFLMAVGATVLGKFLLPDPEPATAAGSTPALDSVAAEGEACVGGRVRRLLAGPVWNTRGTALAWLEKFDEDNEPHVMSWYPGTDEEKAEAKRFFEIAMWRTWRTLEELGALLQQPGPWLIRQNFQETYCFLRTNDEAVMLDTERDEAFSYDPAEAVRLTSEQALKLIPRLMDAGYGKWTGGGAYLEPVKPEDARKCFRSLRFPIG